MPHRRTCLTTLLLCASFAWTPPANGQDARRSSGPEIRGVWAYPGTFGTDSATAHPKIQATLDRYTKAGINTIMMLVKTTSGYVYYESKVGVRDPAYGWDFFATFLAEAVKRKISVHPWFCVFTESALPGQVRAHPEWLIRSKRAEFVPVMNPAHPGARAYEIDLIREFAEKYPVEWIHLDYIRWPCEPTEDYFSFDPQTRALFKEHSGEDIATVRAMDSGNIVYNEWISWNAGHVTEFLRELRQTLEQAKRQVKYSAAVFPDAVNAKVLIGQDWSSWVREGLIDMLCPMLYTNHPGFFEKYSRAAIEVARGHCAVGIGVGIGSAHNQNSPAGLLAQWRIARELGADGIVIFSSGSLGEEFLNILSK